MRVLFLTLYPDLAASPRYRVTQFVPFLQSHGVDCTVVSPVTVEEWCVFTGPDRRGRAFRYHARETPRRLAQILTASRYDVVFVQKALATAYVPGLLAALTMHGKRIVYDIDDAVHLAPPHALRFPWSLLEDRAQVTKLMRSAHLVLAGNAWLAEASRRHAHRVELFPTVVDTDRFSPVTRDSGSFTIGWMGGPSTTPHLEIASEALRDVRDASVVLVGANPASINLPGAIFRPWHLDHEVRDLHEFAVGIMPLPQTPWVQGKCALKALQYMACGIPCVATPFGAVCEIIEHGVNGLFASSTNEWRAAFDRLRDPTERARLGEAARETVRARYALSTAAPRMLQHLESIL